MKRVLFANFTFTEKKIFTKNGVKKLLVQENDLQVLKKTNEFNVDLKIITHGGVALELDEERVAMMLHTTKKKTWFGSTQLDNYEISEDINPIKYSNPVLIFNKKEFNKFIKIQQDFNSFLQNKRYSLDPLTNQYTKHKPEDLFYCAYRALYSVLISDLPAYEITFKNKKMGVNKENNIFVAKQVENVQISQENEKKLQEEEEKIQEEEKSSTFTETKTIILTPSESALTYKTKLKTSIIDTIPQSIIDDFKKIDNNNPDSKIKALEEYKGLRGSIYGKLTQLDINDTEQS